MTRPTPPSASPPPLRDEDLLRQHVAGDTEAFGELFRRHQDRLWAVALRTLGDPHDAADALQDAMINAFRRASSFRSESAVTTWLHRIVVNACLDRLRHRAARPADPVSFDDDIVGATPIAATAHDPAEQTALRVDLEQALASLPAEQRIPLVLIDVEGYPVADVAHMLDLPVGTVKSRCARGRAKLLPLLAPGRLGTTGNRSSDEDVSSKNTRGQGGEHR